MPARAGSNAETTAPGITSGAVVHALTATELAARIRARALSARAVVAAHIGRIEQVNPVINALVADRHAAALAEADALDSAIADGQPVGPLAGVPFTVKEMIDLAGAPNTFGSRARATSRATRDATVVARLRAAGAIPLGVTNVPEWGMWFETDNLIYGRTRNPHDPRRTAGGSSGGEAAIIAAGGAVFGVGSDIGGSIRIPAAFCGVAGHKPSNGLLPLTGLYPVYADGVPVPRGRCAPAVVVGPLARSAHDLPLLVRTMLGPDGIDPDTFAGTLGDERTVDWSGRRVLVLADPVIRFARRSTGDVQRAVRSAADRLAAAGASVTAAPPALFRDVVDLWTAVIRASSSRSFAELAGVGGWPALAGASARWLARRPTVTLPVIMFALGEVVGRMRLRDLDAVLARVASLRARFDELVGAGGVLLMPPHPRAAPRHGAPLRRPFDFAYTAAINVLSAPATVVPLGLDADGLPLAVQIAARRGNDHLTLAAAMRIADGGPPFAPVTPRAVAR